MILPPAALAELAGMDPNQLATVAPVIAPAARRHMRNKAISTALDVFYAAMPITAAAHCMARDLAHPVPGTVKGDTLAKIRALNNGRGLQHRRIIEIAQGISKKCTFL
jgi:hypothetical protein